MSNYCEIYMDYGINKPVLLDLVAGWISGTVFGRNSIAASWGQIEVRDNCFCDEVKSQNRDGFIHFRYVLEIEKLPDVTHDSYVAGIARLLSNAWNLRLRAVAACDFENELPRNGGYKDGAIVE